MQAENKAFLSQLYKYSEQEVQYSICKPQIYEADIPTETEWEALGHVQYKSHLNSQEQVLKSPVYFDFMSVIFRS